MSKNNPPKSPAKSDKAQESGNEIAADDLGADIGADNIDPLLECLVYLTSHYGRAKSAEAIVAGLAYDDRGMGPQLFCEASERLGIKAQVVKRSDPSAIANASMPCVLILDHNQACVALERSKNGKAYKVLMPETGAIKEVDAKTLGRDYKGYCIYVHPRSEFLNPVSVHKEDTDRHWFWGIIHEGRSIYLMVMLASVFINLFVLVSPLFIMNVYDRVIPNNAIETGWALGLGALTIFVFDVVIKIIRGYLIDLSGRKIDVIAGRRLYDQVLNMKLAYRPKSSGVFANMLKDFDSVRDFFTSASIAALVDLPFTLLFLFVIYKLAGSLAFVLMGLILIVLVVGYILQFPLKSLVRKATQSSEAKHGLLVETIHGLETIKSIGSDGRFRSRYGDYVAENASYGQSSRFVSALGVNVSGFVQQIATVVIVLFGMYMVKDGDLSIGGLIAAVILGGRAIAPIGQIANLMTRYHQADGALKTLDRIMQQPVERPQEKQFLHRPDLQGALSFEKVKFVYPGTDRKVLDNISFKIQPGEKVGIIGRVGSGKSTIAKIIMGLYDASGGTVLLDNSDYRQIDPADLRRNTAYIAQDVFLFSGSIRDNIAASLPNASEADILRASKMAGVHDFVSRHPMGYDAPVGEHGSSLSGGQKQAIAFARAILLQPKILVCDEPTNAMDMQAEANFVKFLHQDVKDQTLVLITHRTSMLPAVDRLILLDQGKLIMDGPRDEVIEALNKGAVKAAGT